MYSCSRTFLGSTRQFNGTAAASRPALVPGKFDAGTSQWRGRVSSVSYRAGAALRPLGLCVCLCERRAGVVSVLPGVRRGRRRAGGRRVPRRWRSPARAAGAASVRCTVGAPGPFRAAGWRWRRRPALATGSTPLPPCPPPGADRVDPRPVAGGAAAAWPARPQDPRRCHLWGE